MAPLPPDPPRRASRAPGVRIARAVAEPTPEQRAEPAHSTRRLALLTAAVPLLFFAALELALTLAGVEPALTREDPYVGFAGRIPLFEAKRAPDGRNWWVTAPNKLRYFNAQRFAAQKPANGYRIFCLGGSTTYGHPYADPTSFCGWLRELLPAADPSRSWEVINAGGISYASYREALLVEELVHYQPDLFILLSGHNEFLERRTYATVIETPPALRGLAALLSHTRTYAVLRAGIAALRRHAAPTRAPRSELPAEVQAVLDDAVGPEAYTRDDAQAARIVAHFRFNLVRMIEMAHAAGAEMLLVNAPSNLRDFSPFKSDPGPGLAPAAAAQVAALEAQAREALAASTPDTALARLDAALALDPRRANLYFLRGRALLALGRNAEARAAFVRARDEDVCPLRALSSIEDSVAEIAAAQQVPWVDFEALLDARAQGGIPGDDVFLDHVHPTIAANRELALALLDVLVARGVVTPAPGWGPARVAEVVQRVEGHLDARAHGEALRNVAKVLGWAGKVDEAERAARRAEELAPEDASAHVQVANALAHRGDLAGAEQRLRRALELAPHLAEAHVVLANILLRRDAREEARAHFQAALAADPRTDRAEVGLGVLAARDGDRAQARRHFEAALQLRPDSVDAHNNLGRLLLEQGDARGAAAHFERAVAVDPDIEPARSALAELRRRGVSSPDPRSGS
jgi:tetratricopeptide (TPR) repeat protein